jgi:cell division GTPase FtsZ
MKGPFIYYPIQEMYGSDLSSTKLATELRKDILEQIDLGFNVELDFENVRNVTKGWGRNLLGVIVKEQGEDFIKNHILIHNMNKNVRKYVLEGIQQMLV